MKAREPTTTRANSDCVVCSADGVAVASWLYHTKVADVLELERAAEQAYTATGRPIALVQVVTRTAIVPDGQSRAALARMLANLNGRVAHSAIVHETEGFRAAMIRSIVTGLVALSNPGFPHRVFSSVAEAITWMTQRPGMHDRGTIQLVLAKVRSATPPALEVASSGF